MKEITQVQQVYFIVEIEGNKVERVVILNENEPQDRAWTKLLEELFQEDVPDIKGEPGAPAKKQKPRVTSILLDRVQSIETTFYSNERRK